MFFQEIVEGAKFSSALNKLSSFPRSCKSCNAQPDLRGTIVYEKA